MPTPQHRPGERRVRQRRRPDAERGRDRVHRPDPCDAGPSVGCVSDPTDLASIGVQCAEFIAEWAGDGNQTVVCVHTLSALLEHVGTLEAFRFLHVLTGLVRADGALAHCHLDPARHDEQTVASLADPFCAVVEVAPDGRLTVRRR